MTHIFRHSFVRHYDNVFMVCKCVCKRERQREREREEEEEKVQIFPNGGHDPKA